MAGLTALGLQEALRGSGFSRQPCEAKWRSHPVLADLKPLGFVNTTTLSEIPNNFVVGGEHISKVYKIICNNIYFINFLPVIVFHLILLPIWLVPSLWGVTIVSQIVTTLFLPYFLIELNTNHNLIRGKKLFIINWLLVSISTLVSFSLSYLNWGLASGGILNPDSETILILRWELTSSIILIFILSIIKQIGLLHQEN